MKNNWPVKKLGEVILEVKSGFACAKTNKTDNGIVHLRTNNIDVNGDLDLSVITKIPRKFTDGKVYGLKKGDVLFNNTNSAELVGKTAFITENLDFAFSNHLTRIRVSEELTPEWLVLVFRKLWKEGYFTRLSTQWVNQAGINQDKLKEIEIPVPGIEEQKRIVKKLEKILGKIEEAKKLQQEQLQDLESLKQSVLHQAFREAMTDE